MKLLEKSYKITVVVTSQKNYLLQIILNEKFSQNGNSQQSTSIFLMAVFEKNCWISFVIAVILVPLRC